MDVAAGTVGIVGFALSSTKTIYDTIVGIRNGPDIIQAVSKSLASTIEILHLLQGPEPPVNENSELNKKVQDYFSSVKAVGKKLEGVKNVPCDSRGHRFWRLVKTHLQEKEIRRVHELIRQWMTELSVYLAVEKR